jgi:hypothetical protein
MRSFPSLDVVAIATATPASGQIVNALRRREPGAFRHQPRNAMRILLSASALALAVGLASPASAQCGGGSMGQAGATAAAGGMGGMMCGGATGQRAADDPIADTPAQAQNVGCPCCRHMAMMGRQTGQGGGMQMPGMSMPGHTMPGMSPRASEAPKQQ